MSRYEELKNAVKDVKEPKKSFILSLLKDFAWLEEQIEALRKYPRYVIDEKNPKRQAKLPVHDMLKDYQAQKDDIATKILRSLDGEAEGQSELARILAGFDK